jgi:iron complex transport system permease protein
VLLTAVVGAALTTAGTVGQALVRNALADPFLLGVSSGAGVGATAVLLFGAFASLGAWSLSVGSVLARSARWRRCSWSPGPAASWPPPS